MKARSAEFVKEWANEASEDAEAKSFLDGFFNIFGVSRRRLASFEHHVKKGDGRDGYVDLLWKGVLMVEMKSRGKDLGKALKQAKDYFPGLKEHELPKFVLVSDFEKLSLTDLDTGRAWTFPLAELTKRLHLFGFIAGFKASETALSGTSVSPVNETAARRMAALHDELSRIGYIGHDLQALLVRLLFCLFADDTGIFSPTGHFETFLRQNTKEDGSDLARVLNEVFEVLDTPLDARLRNLDETLAAFPYVNGKLFNARLRTASFDSKMRDSLLACCELDWSGVSPVIFGALFQGVMDKAKRRGLGAHYTSETNILKVIKPLFLDELEAEFEAAGNNANRLRALHRRLHSLKFLDPACGCGNFLVVTYVKLRQLELKILRKLPDVTNLVDFEDRELLNVGQFYGVEIDEFASHIAQVAMWMADHQMNTEAGAEFGRWFARIPLRQSPHILHADALKLDWRAAMAPGPGVYVFGNPPYLGKSNQNAAQKEAFAGVMGKRRNAGSLDFVAAWFVKAAAYIKDTPTRCAFVATSSICQGEQVAPLWEPLLEDGVKIHFAHQFFMWTNESKGAAAVSVVIIGFGYGDVKKRLWNHKGEEFAEVSNISPYLRDEVSAVVWPAKKPLSAPVALVNGAKLTDGGHYLFTPQEKATFLATEPGAAPYFRRIAGAEELINSVERWCLFLEGAAPEELRKLPAVMERVEAVRGFRTASADAATRRDALRPMEFQGRRFPVGVWLAVPQVSAETRTYVPVDLCEQRLLPTDKLFMVAAPSAFHIAILSSAAHMAWLRGVGGRLKNDYSYSAGLVYNTFPWPKVTEAQEKAIGDAAQAVFDVRAKFPSSTLADLYDPRAMPSALAKVHQELDRLVDKAYGWKSGIKEEERLKKLMELYLKLPR